ncbi:MAG: sigma-54-dependent Fis family transcriptional regulator [Myxococcales bacterium]
MTKILVVDDEQGVRYTLQAVLEDAGYAVVAVADGESALRELPQADAVITDLAMPGMDGMELLRQIRASHPRLPVIVITAHGSERHAVEAMKRGACDYLRKPFDIDELLLVVGKAVEQQRLLDQNEELRAQVGLSRPVVYRSEAFGRLMALAHRAAKRNVTVLVTGETGTGKELIAWAIRELSDRAKGPFVRFNAAAVTETLAESELFGHERGAFTGAVKAHDGLFQRAHGGVLFIDEIGEMSPALQVKLLRVLQDGEVRPVGSSATRRVDVRVVAATNRNLAEEVAKGAFREDLYYRVNVVELHVPPLRERPEDIPPLVAHFAARAADRFGMRGVSVEPEVFARLAARPWPGNVRELENAVDRLVALCDGEFVRAGDLELIAEPRAATGSDLALRDRVEHYEAGLIREALDRNGGNQSATARELRISRVTLIDKLNRYGLR